MSIGGVRSIGAGGGGESAPAKGSDGRCYLEMSQDELIKKYSKILDSLANLHTKYWDSKPEDRAGVVHGFRVIEREMSKIRSCLTATPIELNAKYITILLNRPAGTD